MKTLGKLLISCVVYATISHYILAIDYSNNFSTLQTVLRTFVIYSVQFITYISIPLIIGIIIARGLKKNRKKPIDSYINTSLFFGWVIALIALWGAWYADYSINKTSEEIPITESIETMINNEVNSFSNKTPLALNKDITLLSTNYKNGEVHFLYKINYSVEAYDKDKMKLLAKNFFCSDPSSKIFREVASNTLINWKFVDLNGIVILNYSLKGSDCN